jgi:uncharacterized protein (UPF0332 family)
MNPADFISLAIKLSNSQQEVELRTSVNRAYYGAFHSARELLEECGIAFPPKEIYGADIHRKVRFCLANSGDTGAALVAVRLNSLRRQRNYADYDLKNVRFSASHAKPVKNAARVAVEIADALQQCRSEPTLGQLRANVRTYARDVLRLPLQDAQKN